MSPSTLRLIFFSVLLGIACLFTGKTFLQLWNYFHLDQTTQTKDLQWAVRFIQADSFAPQACYTFEVDHQFYQGKTTWYQTYLNQWAAEEAINHLPHELTVWYDSSSPSFSTLEKFFPFKNFFYMMTLWILMLYFWGLHCYLLKKPQNSA